MFESCQTSASIATCKQMFLPQQTGLNTYVILNDSTSYNVPILINMLWTFLRVFIWIWWLVLMKSDPAVCQSCQIFGACMRFKIQDSKKVYLTNA